MSCDNTDGTMMAADSITGNGMIESQAILSHLHHNLQQVPGVHWSNNDATLCLLAGILLGCLVGARMLIFGKVTGISGFLSGAVQINNSRSSSSSSSSKADSAVVSVNSFIPSSDRLLKLAFVGGLIGGGGIASKYLPQSFEDWSDLPIERLIIGGLFVGFGTTLGNGCTSGHGVCGISNLSLRSLAATCTFMIVAIIVAISCNTSSFLPIFRNTLSLNLSGEIVGVCVLLCALFALFSWKLQSYLEINKGNDEASKTLTVRLVSFALEVIFGIFFATVMAISNMTKLSATISFLDLRYWNPALIFVMGGSILVAAILFAKATKTFSAPMLESKFYLLSRGETKIVDLQLLLGATLFGIGWGLTGSCPGPALVNVGSGNKLPLIYAVCIICGMWLQQLANPYISPFLKSKILYGASSTLAAKPIVNTDSTKSVLPAIGGNNETIIKNSDAKNSSGSFEPVTTKKE